MLIGLTLQFFINMEVERYALINGESIFVGFARLFRWLPAWFIVSTFLGFGWPGIRTLRRNALSHVFAIQNPNMAGIALFLAIGCILTLGKVLYQTVETLQKYLIAIGVPFVILLTFSLAEGADFAALEKDSSA